MSTSDCHLGVHGAVDLPDTGGTCCYGATLGPHRCTCWRPIHDLRQNEDLRVGAPTVRSRMCADCAYRPGSPERQGDPEHSADGEQLEDLAAGGTPFWCHDGIRRVAVLVHPSGARVPGHPAAYDPPMLGLVPFKATGWPADLCAGWAARGRALAAPPRDGVR